MPYQKNYCGSNRKCDRCKCDRCRCPREGSRGNEIFRGECFPKCRDLSDGDLFFQIPNNNMFIYECCNWVPTNPIQSPTLSYRWAPTSKSAKLTSTPWDIFDPALNVGYMILVFNDAVSDRIEGVTLNFSITINARQEGPPISPVPTIKIELVKSVNGDPISPIGFLDMELTRLIGNVESNMIQSPGQLKSIDIVQGTDTELVSGSIVVPCSDFFECAGFLIFHMVMGTPTDEVIVTLNSANIRANFR